VSVASEESMPSLRPLVAVETGARCPGPSSAGARTDGASGTYVLADSHLRSWAKSVVWRLAGVVILGGLSWAYTRNREQTTMITVTFHSIRLVLYYGHERIWEGVRWGRTRVREDYQI